MPTGRNRSYLDHNASAPLLDGAREALCAALSLTGNPSSVHQEGRRARACLDAARRDVAGLVGAVPESVVFASGATESAAMLLGPDWLVGGRATRFFRLAVLATDHSCLRDGGSFPPDRVTRLPVDADGLIEIDALRAFVAQAPEPSLLALCLANSETGVVQPLDAIHAAIAGAPVTLVLDIVQAAGRMPIDAGRLGAAALILSGHKIGAAKGIGAAVIARAETRPMPLLRGGGQERGLRAGTPALALAASFGAAAALAATRTEGDFERLADLRDRLEARLVEGDPRIRVAGAGASRLVNTSCLVCPGVKGETAQMALDLAGFAVSSGSACTSGKVGRSAVLAAMAEGGAPFDAHEGAIRVSFGYETGQAEIDDFAEAYLALAARAGGREKKDRAA
ncbi:cysteine desulfurase family protein [Aurantimonas sp. Leaf443]|uniref:cysteine desulfurase family protein n=1 Tax=Aurantimonas sp. Leaf443 TaxID=1736378 RepID=UPI0006FBC74A|nr:cysteine desulfurase family protein [Aurantimonas sp. Leaf443]KQT83524.1 hypothetical protein ASG48_13350 [Aurantimonas sp. Leaf443]